MLGFSRQDNQGFVLRDKVSGKLLARVVVRRDMRNCRTQVYVDAPDDVTIWRSEIDPYIEGTNVPSTVKG